MNYIKRFGTEYGGFYYPSDLPGLNENSTIYCVGAGEDISHDIELAHRLNSSVYIFDPTPRAITHVNMVKTFMKTKKVPEYIDNPSCRQVGGGIGWGAYWQVVTQHPIENTSLNFMPIGIGVNEGKKKFYTPENSEYVSHSLVEGFASTDFIEVEIKKLKTVMNHYGHKHIDLLKLDIEGTEFAVIEDMVKENILPKYISIDCDLARKKKGGTEFENLIRQFNHLNYKVINFNNFDISFIKVER